MIVASKREKAGYYLFLLPALVIFVAFIFGPMLYSFVLSLFKYNMMTVGNPEFIGFDNFTALFLNPAFWDAVRNTVVYSIGTVPVSLALGLLIALPLSNKLVGAKNLYRVCYYIPYVSSMVAVSIVFSLFFNASSNGVMNQLLVRLGFAPLGWLSSAKLALPVIMVLDVWKHLGYVMVIYLGGLLSIPEEIYEAAALDNVTPWVKLTRLTIPLLRPTTLFLLVTQTINSFQVFTPVQILTEGGPGRATTMLVVLLYQKGFSEYKMGIASAIAVLLFLALMALSILQNRLARDS